MATQNSQSDVVIRQRPNVHPLQSAVEMNFHCRLRCGGVPLFEGGDQLPVLVDGRVDGHREKRVVENQVDLGAVEERFDMPRQHEVARGPGNDQVNIVVDAVVRIQVPVFEDFDLFLNRMLAGRQVAADQAWAGSVRNVLLKLADFLKVVVGRTLNFQIFFISSTGEEPEKVGTDVGRSIYKPPEKIRPLGVKDPFYWILSSVRRNRGIARIRSIARVVATTFVVNPAVAIEIIPMKLKLSILIALLFSLIPGEPYWPRRYKPWPGWQRCRPVLIRSASLVPA